MNYTSWQAKLQEDVSSWVAEQAHTRTDCAEASVIRDTLEFVKLIKRATHELTPANHAIDAFLRQLDINCYYIASRKIDIEVPRTRPVAL